MDQAEFRELSVSAGSTSGVTANISSFKNGSKSITWVQSRRIRIRIRNFPSIFCSKGLFSIYSFQFHCPMQQAKHYATVSKSNVKRSLLLVNNKLSLIRTVKPDFLLVRQNLRDANENHKKLLLGFRYKYYFHISCVDPYVLLLSDTLVFQV